MPKFYVDSGNIQTVIDAGCAEKAALWVVHRVMSQVLPVDDEVLANDTVGVGTEASNKGSNAGKEMLTLGEQVRVSEVGFGGVESETLDTLSLVVHWQKLMIALSRLEDLLERRQASPQMTAC